MSARRAELLAATAAIARAAGEGALRALAERVRARVEARAPSAVAVLGRRGVGKSSLVEALTASSGRGGSAGVVARAVPTTPGLALLDAPGFRGGDRSWPALAQELLAWAPVATLFVVSATEVDALRDDIALIARFLRALPAARRRCVAVVNKVDELDPVDDHAPPFRHPRKGFHIAEASARARMNLARGGVDVEEVVPVSALVVRDGGRVLHDGRWNVERVADALRRVAVETPPHEGVDALREDVRALARAWAAHAGRLSGAERAAATTVLSRLVGRPAEEVRWSRHLLGDAMARLARAAPDLEGVSA